MTAYLDLQEVYPAQNSRTRKRYNRDQGLPPILDCMTKYISTWALIDRIKQFEFRSFGCEGSYQVDAPRRDNSLNASLQLDDSHTRGFVEFHRLYVQDMRPSCQAVDFTLLIERIKNFHCQWVS